MNWTVNDKAWKFCLGRDDCHSIVLSVEEDQVLVQKTFVLLKEKRSVDRSTFPVFERAREQLSDILERQRDIRRTACVFVVMPVVWLISFAAPSPRGR